MAYASKANIAGVPTNNMKVPSDGSQASFLGLFGMPGTYTLELNKFEQGQNVELPQTLFFDASSSTGSVTIVFQGTQQTLVMPAQSQGYIPILTPDEPTFTITGSGGGSVGLTFVSVPLPAQIWSVAAGGATSVTAAQGLPNTDANAWPVKITVGGADASTANPVPVSVQGNIAGTVTANQGTANTDANAWPSKLVLGGADVAAGNPVPVTIVSDTATIPVSDTTTHTSLATLTATIGSDATTAPTTMDQVGGVYRTSALALANGQGARLGMDVAGNLQATEMGLVATSVSELAAGTITQALATPYGARIVDTETLTPSYSVATGFSIPASASGLAAFWIKGSATKTIRIKRLILNAAGFPSTAEGLFMTVYRYSGATAFAGSAIITPTLFQMDINDAAPSAVVQANNGGTITAGPTQGAAFRGAVFNDSSGVSPSSVEYDFVSGGKSVVLRGTSDWIGITVTLSSTTAVAAYVSIDWTEV